MRILLVEDDRKIAKALESGLSAEGYSVSLSATGEDGFFAANEQHFDLILLDLMLPGRGGLEILKTLRAKGVGVPVLILTAKDALDDRVAGLDAGADDYLIKPFAFPELLARIRALARRLTWLIDAAPSTHSTSRFDHVIEGKSGAVLPSLVSALRRS